MRKRLRRALWFGSVAIALVACGSDPSSSTGDAAVSCAQPRSALLAKIRQSQGCTVDADCMQYNAVCLQEEAGNCAGIFYVDKSAEEALDKLDATYAVCAGAGCSAGGACGLGGLPPACVDGLCTGLNRQ